MQETTSTFLVHILLTKMSKDILLAYKCPCGKYHDIFWSVYKQLNIIKYDKPKLNCYCDIIQTLIQ